MGQSKNARQNSQSFSHSMNQLGPMAPNLTNPRVQLVKTSWLNQFWLSIGLLRQARSAGSPKRGLPGGIAISSAPPVEAVEWGVFVLAHPAVGGSGTEIPKHEVQQERLSATKGTCCSKKSNLRSRKIVVRDHLTSNSLFFTLKDQIWRRLRSNTHIFKITSVQRCELTRFACSLLLSKIT